jgi:hypothetical protein
MDTVYSTIVHTLCSSMDTVYSTIVHILGASLFPALLANSILFFVPTWVMHTVLGNWLAGRRIRYDKPARQLTFAGVLSMDTQFKKEWLHALEVAVGALGTVVLEKALVQVGAIAALPTSTEADWGLIGRPQFLVYFVVFDLYYYLLHRFVLHGPLGSWCHQAHHDSYLCTPSTGFSFHWVEGGITGGVNPLLAHLLGFDSRTVMVCQLYGMVDTICHHAGIQIYPSWWDTNVITKWYLSPQFHDVHHEKVRHPPPVAPPPPPPVTQRAHPITPLPTTRCPATTADSRPFTTISLGPSTAAIPRGCAP